MCCNKFVRFNLQYIRWITSVDDMIQIMTVGSQLYSSLSLLARQSMCNVNRIARNGYSVGAIFPA